MLHDLGWLGMAAERGPGGFSWGRPVPLITPVGGH